MDAAPAGADTPQETDAPIHFYASTDPWLGLSNDYPQGFEDEAGYWPSVEHDFQAMKFAGPEHAAYRERVRTARGAGHAKDLGRTRKIPIRADWDEVRDDVMLHALRSKFAHPKLRAVLLSTGDRLLAEASPSDFYWGLGSTGTGENRLGKLLMQVRDELRED